MRPNRSASMLRVLAVTGCAVLASGCRKPPPQGEPASEGVSPEKAADMLYAVMAADREVYATHVIGRLVNEQRIRITDADGGQALLPSEHWKTERGTLPLPAQMFRMGAERAADQDAGFHYALLSEWPINKQNKSKTGAEIAGLDAVIANHGEKPYYAHETLGDQKYFTAVYADRAVSPACVECHNGHKDSPRHDFKVGDVMGGVVIRIPL